MYRVSHLAFVELTWIWTFHIPLSSQFCQIPSAQARWADSRRGEIKVNPTQVSGQIGHPVQSGASYLSQGFEDNVFGKFPRLIG